MSDISESLRVSVVYAPVLLRMLSKIQMLKNIVFTNITVIPKISVSHYLEL